ncbi:2-hydroxyacid dehydrogenase [Dactylosporangium roseum]|uniref:2-hydroxyacid dehydrogenase n=1 Tax=Dactylosporangium roseum TaxID=47989 RepID=A0ABY5ZBN8_9ACTN|nr:2-hydroxyacid dehydrogenase [Dactylosporangium roseum]UWZ38118.1 2-hydroxyacid dehydrogenase [Dactylosporangium roseum]
MTNTTKIWIPHERGSDLLGPVPEGCRVEIMPSPDELPSDPADVVFWVPPFLAKPDVVTLAERMPALRVVQLMTAGADAWTGRLPSRVTLCDARGVHDSSTAEWVVAAILAFLRDFPVFARAQERGHWAYRQTGELAGKRVLIVGSGSIGRALEARLLPFEVSVTRVARRPRPGVHGVAELAGLLPSADIVVLLVPLTAETIRLVDKAFLGRLPDGALLVNAARGPVVDTEAIMAEVSGGRIGFAADVIDPEPLPSDHPLWRLPNVLLTPHVAGSVRGLLPRAYGLAGEQLRRFVAGAPLDNVVSDGY